MSPVAAALHNQGFVMFCYIYIRKGGLLKAVVLIQRNRNLSCGALCSPPPPLRCPLHAADIISNHLGEAAFVEIEIGSLECPDCVQLCRGFHPQLNYPFFSAQPDFRQNFLGKSPLHMYDSINILQ